MTPDLETIAADLAEVKRQNQQILELLQLHTNPSATVSIAAKAKLVRDAMKTGDKGRLKQALKMINNQ